MTPTAGTPLNGTYSCVVTLPRYAETGIWRANLSATDAVGNDASLSWFLFPPGFPTDLTSIALVLATQAHGTVLIHEKMFENRLFFVDRLIAMGARVVLCDPHRALVTGPSRLSGLPRPACSPTA